MTMTMIHDVLDRPYLYVANKEGGLVIYDVTNIDTPLYMNSLSIDFFDSLDVMSVSQSGTFLYLALGNHFITPERTGMAIVDVTGPTFPFPRDYWVYSGPAGGGGMVQVEDNYAYLGGMTNGLFVFDVSDKDNIDSLSHFMPDLDFPEPNPDTPKYNLRGLVVKDAIVYAAFDAGGVRIINCTDKANPRETGRYSNPVMNGKPRAYNNLVVDDTLIYVTADYCGLEVLNISDTSNITQVSWWNPWTCETNPFNWFISDGHSNEIMHDPDCDLLFISTGRSDMYVVDISDPAAPDSCNHYGNVTDSLGTWGVSRYRDKLFLSYICVPWPYIPFPGIWTGVKVMSYEDCLVGVEEQISDDLTVTPNPVHTTAFVECAAGITATLRDMMGRRLNVPVARSGGGFTIDMQALPEGSYPLTVVAQGSHRSCLIIKSAR
jgi:hypothetical protein